jgi:hypothetical protein
MRTRHAVCLTAAAVVSLAVASCAGKKDAAPVGVQGQVQYTSKKPVANMVLTFHPLEDTSRSRLPTFLLDKDGRFEDRIPPGRYKATLAPIPVGSGHGPAAGPDAGADKGPSAAGRLDRLKRYRDRDQSPWEIVIPEGGRGDLLLTVD